jgi:hypothetical protein
MRERFLQARKSGELSKEVNVDDYTHPVSLIDLRRSIHPSSEWSTKAELKRASQMALRHLGY